jgi:nicotinamidase-related amidase
VIFIQHTEAGGWKREAKGLRCCLNSISLLARFVTKTACDAFYNTGLEALLREQGIREFVICGCATDYCVDATIKNGVSRGYHITVAEDAHTTANRPAADAQILINHHNDVWRNFIAPANPLAVKRTETILENWKAN